MSSPGAHTAQPSAPAQHQAAARSILANNLALIAILLLAAFVRFYALDASSLWNDEGTTWALLARSYAEIGRDAAADIHPPGYYWLLKLWSALPGTSAWAMRSLSAVLGVFLVFVVYRIGVHLDASRPLRVTALLAALVAALNPFQVYYGQEARMYMLLAVTGACLFWSLFALVRQEAKGDPVLAPLAGYVACGTVGMWTHYSFPIVLAAAGLAYVVNLVRSPDSGPAPRSRRLLRFVAANAAVVLLFLPWLPVAVNRVLTWPKGGEYTSLLDGLAATLQTMMTGPIRSAPDLAWPFLLVAALLPLAGLWALRTGFGAPALGLWWLAPVAMMFALGLFSDAFLKFLLVASPAWCLLVAAAPLCCRRPQRLAQLAVAGAAALLAVLVLPDYYADPVARDNYASVSRYVQAAGDPARDIVVVNAPGQQDVWTYYDPGLPMLPLPEQRPPDAEQTVAKLASALDGRRHAYALLWATDESDPDRIVETWLDQNAFKGVDTWQGNMRFVVYTFATGLHCRDLEEPAYFGEAISLRAQCRTAQPQQTASGDTAVLALHWQTSSPLDASYKVSVQLLDDRNQVIAQHDSLPAGGSRPTSGWAVDEIVVDNHGLPIPPGTPPGSYRLIVAMYDTDSGERLSVSDAGHLELGAVDVMRPQQPAPANVIPMQHRLSRTLGPLRLIGFEAFAKGYGHAPNTPLRPGDIAHVTLFWQAPDPLPGDWPRDMTFTLRLGDQVVSAPVAGGGYPTAMWQPGEIVRAEFDIPYDGTNKTPVISAGGDELALQPLPAE